MHLGICFLNEWNPKLVRASAATEDKIFVTELFVVAWKSIIDDDISPSVILKESEDQGQAEGQGQEEESEEDESRGSSNEGRGSEARGRERATPILGASEKQKRISLLIGKHCLFVNLELPGFL